MIITSHEEQQELDLQNIKGKKIAVVNRYAIHEYLERDHPDLNLVPVADYSEGLRGVAFGKYDLFIANLASLSYFIDKEGITNLRVAGETGYFITLSIVARKGIPELIPLLNKGLSMISAQEHSAIFGKWIKLADPSSQWWQLSREQIIALLSALAGMMVMAILFWNYQLRRTVRKRTKQLREAVGKLDSALKEQALILSNAQIGIAHVIDRKLQWINPKLAEQRGMPEEKIVGQDTRIFYLSDEDYFRVGQAYSTVLAEGNRFEEELRFRKGEDESYWCRLVGQAIDPEHVSDGTIWLLQDISAQKELEEYLTEKATTDYLTGVNNRRHFSELGSSEIKRSKRSRSSFLSVLMLDIDHFKHINDDYGHAIGDEALKYFTKTVQSMLRDHDILGRVGGEEFAVLLPETERESALHVAERIREAVAAGGVEANGENISFSVSIGLTGAKNGESDLDTLLAAADKALYEAKNSGRNRVVAIGGEE
ncbi:diguanylate cyclase [Pseudomonadota bacterium]